MELRRRVVGVVLTADGTEVEQQVPRKEELQLKSSTARSDPMYGR